MSTPGGELAEVIADWSGRLDRLCADLEEQGFNVDREGLSVFITLPDDSQSKPGKAEPAPI